MKGCIIPSILKEGSGIHDRIGVHVLLYDVPYAFPSWHALFRSALKTSGSLQAEHPPGLRFFCTEQVYDSLPARENAKPAGCFQDQPLSSGGSGSPG